MSHTTPPSLMNMCLAMVDRIPPHQLRLALEHVHANFNVMFKDSMATKVTLRRLQASVAEMDRLLMSLKPSSIRHTAAGLCCDNVAILLQMVQSKEQCLVNQQGQLDQIRSETAEKDRLLSFYMDFYNNNQQQSQDPLLRESIVDWAVVQGDTDEIPATTTLRMKKYCDELKSLADFALHYDEQTMEFFKCGIEVFTNKIYFDKPGTDIGKKLSDWFKNNKTPGQGHTTNLKKIVQRKLEGIKVKEESSDGTENRIGKRNRADVRSISYETLNYMQVPRRRVHTHDLETIMKRKKLEVEQSCTKHIKKE